MKAYIVIALLSGETHTGPAMPLVTCLELAAEHTARAVEIAKVRPLTPSEIVSAACKPVR